LKTATFCLIINRADAFEHHLFDVDFHIGDFDGFGINKKM
jgi:hypothetical protein